MEEDLNEDELEERLYAMIHYVDDTQQSPDSNQKDDNTPLIDTPPTSTIKRYWRTKPTPCNQPFVKVNSQTAPKPGNTPPINIGKCFDNPNINKPNQEKHGKIKTDSPAPLDMSIFLSPIPEDTKTTIQILENDEISRVVELETSDEDEVVEVAIPPKPTITIESSDEEDLVEVTPIVKKGIKVGKPTKENLTPTKEGNSESREVSASPVPSVVSSVSDDFIRSDCIALKISSRKPDDHSFDFSLHGSDLLDHGTPSRKKKKKNKEASNPTTPASTTNGETPEKNTQKTHDGCFATPKSKQKKKQKFKTYKVTEPIIPNADVYDSDSNHSASEFNKKKTYFVDNKSCPNDDIYESDTSQSEIMKKPAQHTTTNMVINPVAVRNMESANKKTKADMESASKKTKADKCQEAVKVLQTISDVVDLTEDLNQTVDSSIQENIVIGNVTGFEESEDYGDAGDSNISNSDTTKLGSTKIPAILSENLDFDYLKGQESTTLKHRYSLKSLREEMQRFYNESWGGENFNHKEIQKTMSRDRSLWEIDPKDRMPVSKRRVTCNYCNRVGHRDDSCRMKPAVCHMCGNLGHYETRCPNKICVNCGSPNYMYSCVCRVCSGWARVSCSECGQRGHPHSHCPDLWRRYHNTIDSNMPLEKPNEFKKYGQLFCSGCTRRGHLVHACRSCLPFSGLPVNTPYVLNYRPLYPPTQATTPTQPASTPDRKRQSKSPTCHSTHQNKKRTFDNTPDYRRNSCRSNPSESNDDDKNQTPKHSSMKSKNEKTPVREKQDASSSNRDKNGKVIQDNEVSDTSVATTTSRIYVTDDVIEKLKTNEGRGWLQQNMVEHDVSVEHAGLASFLTISGTHANQEAFQSKLRDWMNTRHEQGNRRSVSETSQDDSNQNNPGSSIPKNRNNVLRQLNKAFESLNDYLGEPNAMLKELTYLQDRRDKLMKQKIVSPKQLSNNKDYIKDMVKKLNMILLGQAGLADGSKHLEELHSFQAKLSTYRHKELPMDLRKQIGEHYRCIFAGLPRDDYAELIQKYYQNHKKVKPKKKNKRGRDNRARFCAQNGNTVNGGAAGEGGEEAPVGAAGGGAGDRPGRWRPRSAGVAARRARTLLARRLRRAAAAAAAGPAHAGLTPKQLKTFNKITQQAQLFL